MLFLYNKWIFYNYYIWLLHELSNYCVFCFMPGSRAQWFNGHYCRKVRLSYGATPLTIDNLESSQRTLECIIKTNVDCHTYASANADKLNWPTSILQLQYYYFDSRWTKVRQSLYTQYLSFYDWRNVIVDRVIWT